MQTFGLTPIQLEVVNALSNGANSTAAAAQAGIHRNTITEWRRSNLPFRQALAYAVYDKANLHREKAEADVDLAYQQIHEILSDPKTPSNVRLRAAQYIIEKASTPPPPKPEIILDIERTQYTQSEPVEVPADQPNLHTSAHQPIRRESPKVGRNEPCPCNSGRKFKQCCLNQQPFAQAA